MSTSRKIGYSLLALVFTLCIALRIWWLRTAPERFMSKRIEMCRSARLDFSIYEDDHNDTFPADLTVFANEPPTNYSGSEYTQPDWKSFYYVSGLWTNDPPEMPRIIYVSENPRAPGGAVLFLDGTTGWVPLDYLQKWIREPWEIESRNAKGIPQPLNGQTKEALRKRVKVLPPINDAGTH